MMARWLTGCVLVVATAATAIAAAQAQEGQTRSAQSGEELFGGKCLYCHDRTGWGTRALARRMAPEQAELLRRKAIPAMLVRHVVRRGAGSMPQFTPTDLSDAELDRLTSWLEGPR